MTERKGLRGKKMVGRRLLVVVAAVNAVAQRDCDWELQSAGPRDGLLVDRTWTIKDDEYIDQRLKPATHRS